MASAGGSVRKLKDLEAGRKRLEEFRRKKAEKKVVVTEQAVAATTSVAAKDSYNDIDLPDTHSDNLHFTSTSTHEPVETETFDNGPISSSQSIALSNGPSGSVDFQSASHRDASINEESKINGRSEPSGLPNLANGYHWGGHNAVYHEDDNKTSTTLSNMDPPSFLSSSRGVPAWSRESSTPDGAYIDTERSQIYLSSNESEKTEFSYLQGKSRSSATSLFSSLKDPDMTLRESYLEEALPSTSQPTSLRSRPSFLEPIGAQHGSSILQAHDDDSSRTLPASSSSSAFESPFRQQIPIYPGNYIVEKSVSSGLEDSGPQMGLFTSTSISSGTGHGLGHHNVAPEFQASVKDDDFAALEQHIEDLTKEKFSLQRDCDNSRSLAQTLASENSSLTDRFNQQGQVINQLRSDIERLQEEIKAQKLELESFRLQYANAQLECNAADERAKVLASEVISLEEKALRLRSNELKLEKQVESLNSEMMSFRKRVSNMEKERQDFQSTIEVLQEERKLFQSKLRKAAANEKAIETGKSSRDTKEASTATEDIVLELPVNDVAVAPPAGTSNAADRSDEAGTSLMPGSALNTILEDETCHIPDDQIRSIENINSLISELAVEREELTRALRIESSNCSKLKELNKDLTHKLEVQTQRLELLAAQRMANEHHALMKPPDANLNLSNDVTLYADEGDEVVERVLGWIMKLFPGGPKRRTSKLH